jgi:hypothetical protein
MIVQGYYNAGMNPFAKQLRCRFEGDLGAVGTVYEFNVKIHRLPSAASEEDWYFEVEKARAEFETRLQVRHPSWLVAFTGRSGGWLTIEDREGKMTEKRLEALADRVDRALDRFKARMVKKYPRKPELDPAEVVAIEVVRKR